MSPNPPIRLNKYLAKSGLGSRRFCDSIIKEGQVLINGQPCITLATLVHPEDTVRVGNRKIILKQPLTILFNKPRGYLCSKKDESNRPTIYDLLPPNLHHLNHVGRLDMDSEGLIILTTDGDLANRLTHPSHNLEKEYLVTLHEAFPNDILPRLLKGVHTPEGKARAVKVKRLSPRRVSITLNTGLKRQIRYMFQAVSLQVRKLTRIRIGSFTDAQLKLGRWRTLTEADIAQICKQPKNTKPPRKSPT